jgi:hypothetical protein
VERRDEGEWTIEIQGVLEPALEFPVSFGGQCSIQLSYGRLFVSIDETPVAGNAPPHCKKGPISVVKRASGAAALFERPRIS